MSILQSIKPQYCELIASGKKTIEVRKTRPKLQTPFKVYIYCTIGQRIPNGFGGVSEALKQPLWKLRNGTVVNYLDVETMDVFQCEKLNGKVIGEYVCDYIIPVFSRSRFWITDENLSAMCMSYLDISKYAGGALNLYGWHISDLKIYDKPNELGEFVKYGYEQDYAEWEHYSIAGVNGKEPNTDDYKLTRPPQSWCYVEEV